MTNPIEFPRPIPSMDAMRSPAVAKPDQAAPGADFKSILIDSLNEVNRLQTEADAGVQRLLTGEANNVAEVLAAADKAGIAFDLLMEVRNKLTEAYRELQQMRI